MQFNKITEAAGKKKAKKKKKKKFDIQPCNFVITNLLLFFSFFSSIMYAQDKMNNNYFDVQTPDNISEADLSSSDKKRYRITRAW